MGLLYFSGAAGRHACARGGWMLCVALVALIGLTLTATDARAQDGGPGVTIVFDTELLSLNLSGGPFPMPLASDPGNLLPGLPASVSGYGYVDSLVTITLSSQRDPAGPQSLGQAWAFNKRDPAGAAPGVPGSDPINPSELDGEAFFVQSFFDVFFDITVTDVDTRAGRDFAGQVDGASITLPDQGAAHMQNFYEAIFDADAPNFGLIPPPEVFPYIGHFNIEIPLGGDINGNGEPDKIKFTLAAHQVGGQNRTFITLPDGTVIDSFDSEAALDGLVVDQSTDPPFTIGGWDGAGDPSNAFGGPTTASSNLRNPIRPGVIPEPASVVVWILLGGAALFLGWRRGKA